MLRVTFLIVFFAVGCGSESSDVSDMGIADLPSDIGQADADFGEEVGHEPDMVVEGDSYPYCVPGGPSVWPRFEVDEEFVFPASSTDMPVPAPEVVWEEFGITAFSIRFMGPVGKQSEFSGAWLPFGSDVNLKLIDHYVLPSPTSVLEYRVVSVLVDYKSVDAEYEWEWKGEQERVRSFFMKGYPHRRSLSM